MHFYRFFGLKFSSEFKLPFVAETDKLIPDVYIHFGKTPESLTNIKNHGVLYQTAENEFLFWLNRIGRYYVKGGSEIIIEKDIEATDRDIYTFLAGTVLGALFQQRKLLALHGCALEKNGNAFIISGKTGSGKSSIALYMCNDGFSIIADDISVMNFNENGGVSIEKGSAYLKLWQDSLQRFDKNISSYRQLRNNINKYIFPIKLSTQNNLLQTIVVLRTTNIKEFKTREIYGAEKFNCLRRNVYKPQFVKNTTFEKDAFLFITSLAQKCKIIEVTQPTNEYYPEKIQEVINKQLS